MDLEQSTMSQTAALSVGSIVFEPYVTPDTSQNTPMSKRDFIAPLPSIDDIMGTKKSPPFTPPLTLRDALDLGNVEVKKAPLDPTLAKAIADLKTLATKVRADFDQMDFFNRTEGGGHALSLNKLGLIQVALERITKDLETGK